MTQQPSSTENLSIRSAPAPVRRFSKKALLIGLGGAGLLIMLSFSFAMSPTSEDEQASSRELYSTSNKPKAEGFAMLPASYDRIASASEPEVPTLGPPLPGDLGAPILQAQNEGRFSFNDPLPTQDPEVDDAALEIARREEERELAARESALFFSKSTNSSQPQAEQPPLIGESAVRDPFEALSALQLQNGDNGFGMDANFQGRKEAFLSTTSDASIYNPYRIEAPRSPWQVMAGTVIPATLLTGINSDLPGQVVGQVTESVYDTVTGNTVLIPQGSRIVGHYDSVVAYGQSRALVVWNRIIMPDGTSIRIENLPGVDGRGNAGLKDRVDRHSLRIFSAAAFSSLISIGAELSDDDDDRIARALRDAAQDGASQVGNEVVRRQLNVQPTITIRPGWRLRILVHQDIILQPYGGQ